MDAQAQSFQLPAAFLHLLRLMVILATAITLLIVLSVGTYSVYSSSFQDRVFPGVSIHGMDLSGLDSSAAALQLAGAFTYPQQGRITFHYGDKAWTAAPKDLGLSLDYISSIHAAMSVGRSLDDFTNALTLYHSRFDGTDVSPVIQYDARQTLTYLQGIAAEIEQPAAEARLELKGGQVVAQPGQIGHSVDLNAMLALVAVPIGHLTDGDLPLVVHDIQPQVLDASAQADAARSLLAQNFSITIAEPQAGDPGPWTLPSQTLADMLLFRHVNDSGVAQYSVSLDSDKLTVYLKSLSPSLVAQPQNARFTFNTSSGQLTVYHSAVRGRMLDIAQSAAAIQSAAAQGQHQANLAIDYINPSVTDTATAAQLGIAGLLPNGWQYTSFAGSIPNRIQNIQLASEKLNGVLVAPGETFSMAKYVGSVSQEAGYADGLVILGNAIVTGPGGGVCQVSTTLYRTALETGFPIIERHAHALRVSYYETGDGPVKLGVGYDATVSLPDVDFKFLNDSPYYILMETNVDTAHNLLNWYFYSTSDGRSVRTSSDGIKNVTKANPSDEWLPDTKVPLHGYSFVYHAQDGADVTIHRWITKNGATTQEDIKTHYLPWPNQCSYNPATPFPKGTKCPPK